MKLQLNGNQDFPDWLLFGVQMISKLKDSTFTDILQFFKTQLTAQKLTVADIDRGCLEGLDDSVSSLQMLYLIVATLNYLTFNSLRHAVPTDRLQLELEQIGLSTQKSDAYLHFLISNRTALEAALDCHRTVKRRREICVAKWGERGIAVAVVQTAEESRSLLECVFCVPAEKLHAFKQMLKTTLDKTEELSEEISTWK